MAEKHSKCRLCGERHRLGHCPQGFGKTREKLGRTVKPLAEVAAKAKAPVERKRAAPAKAKRKAPAPVVKSGAVKRGRPRIGEEKNTIAAQKPWLKLKMSERTWWRRQAEKSAQ